MTSQIFSNSVHSLNSENHAIYNKVVLHIVNTNESYLQAHLMT